MIIGSFLFFTALVAGLTYFITRKDERSSNDGYFLGGRSLTFPLIAGSLLLTNLSTEQMVGLNGDAFTFGLSVMVWEVVAVLAPSSSSSSTPSRAKPSRHNRSASAGP
jgi:SSS family solute:Na+ symporter